MIEVKWGKGGEGERCRVPYNPHARIIRAIISIDHNAKGHLMAVANVNPSVKSIFSELAIEATKELERVYFGCSPGLYLAKYTTHDGWNAYEPMVVITGG